MANWFYTDAGANQQGPVDDAGLLQLNTEGRINAKSLVWREGMDGWMRFRDVAAPLFGESEEGVPTMIGVCAYSSRVYPMEEMLPYGEAVIGLEHKEAFIQQLMEMGTVKVADATEKRFEYAGFWWRCLSSFLDYLIKLVPYFLCLVPYYVVIFSMGMNESDIAEMEDFPIALAVALGAGFLGIMSVSVFYETWMVGKYQATLGKQIIGMKVVNPDGGRLTYMKAFIRWGIKKPVNTLIIQVPTQAVFFLMIFGVGGVADNTLSGDGSATVMMAITTGMFVSFAVAVLCSGIYWMAAFDEEKRTLHDRICGTRVIKK